MKYPKTIIDECSGLEVPSELYKVYQDGQMSVVEWIESHKTGGILPSSGEIFQTVIMTSWQSKLKEWGL